VLRFCYVCRQPDGVTPVFVAAQKGHTTTLEALIHAQADINKARVAHSFFPAAYLQSTYVRVFVCVCARVCVYAGVLFRVACISIRYMLSV
jgi:hypothetical protein